MGEERASASREQTDKIQDVLRSLDARLGSMQDDINELKQGKAKHHYGV
ncbi:MAG: hypothetical protein WA667_07755 [Candidatus Nitrosopolaris sp.]